MRKINMKKGSHSIRTIRYVLLFVFCIMRADPVNYYSELDAQKNQYITDAIKIRPSGFIKSEVYGDTRRNVGIAADQYIIIPEPRRLDVAGSDINAHSCFAMSAVETRLRFDMNLDNMFYHDLLGVIEGDFWGHFDILPKSQSYQVDFAPYNFQRFRLRLAYMQLDWPHSMLIGGHYWHPIFVPECYPDTVSFNQGSPIDPYTRSPQFRYTGLFNDWHIIIAMLMEATNTTVGSQGSNTIYMRNGAMPEFHIQMQRLWGEHIAGIGVDVKRIVPEIASDNNLTSKTYSVHESLVSAAVIAYTAFNWEKGAIRTKLTWAQNGTDFGLLSGYGVTSIDTVTGSQTYTNTAVLTWWADACYRYKSIEPGFFIGMSKNRGASQPLYIFPKTHAVQVYAEPYKEPHYAGLVVRFSPRIRWKSAPLEIAGELEYTRAVYGKLNECGKTTNNVPVYNIRLNLSTYYFF